MDEQEKVCICNTAYDPHQFMIECAYCDKWFHGACVDISEAQALSISFYSCTSCTKQGQETHWANEPKFSQVDIVPLPYRFGNMNLKDFSTLLESDEPIHCENKNAEMFRRRLLSGMFAKSGVRRCKGNELNLNYIKAMGFEEPIMCEESEGLGLQMPPNLTNTNEMENVVGTLHYVKMCQVESQSLLTMTMEEWITMKRSEHEPMNFEFQISDTKFENSVVPPEVVSSMDWAAICPIPESKTAKYIVKKEFDDFSNCNQVCLPTCQHVYGIFEEPHTYKDFNLKSGGASYWHHVIEGEVYFFLIPPTQENLDKYAQWKKSPRKSFLFFGDVVDKCIQCILQPRCTLLIPSGWLTATLTVTKSQAYGGFFLHGFHIGRQVAMYEYSTKMNLEPMWTINNVMKQTWHSVRYYISRLQLLQSGNSSQYYDLSDWERKGLFSLLPVLRKWYRDSGPTIDAVTPLKLISALQLALGTLDSQSTSSTKDNLQLSLKSKSTQGGVVLESVCKCHLKKCLNCRNCVKRHCTCLGKETHHRGCSSATGSSTSSPHDEMDMDESSGSHHTSSGYNSSDVFPDLEWPCTQSESVWDDSLVHPIDTSGAFEFLADQDLGLGMGDIELSNTYGIDLGDPSPSSDDCEKGFLSPRTSPRSGTVSNSVDAATKHRASCHRCGNLRKKNLRCSKCPHIFCQKCAEKMLSEHGLRAFDSGCPVCKELCCCGKNRCINCTRKYHCYKKCPLTKRGSVISPGTSKLSGDVHVTRGPFALGGRDDLPAVASQLSPQQQQQQQQQLYKSHEMDPSKMLASHITAEEEAMIFPDFTSGVIEDSLFPVSVGEMDCVRSDMDAPACFSDIDVEFVDLEMP